MYLAGDEYELRPISAIELYMAEKEGRDIAASLNAQDDEKGLFTAAAVLAKGLKLKDETPFNDGRAVLDAFSAEEIYRASKEYAADVESMDMLKEMSFSPKNEGGASEENLGRNHGPEDGKLSGGGQLREQGRDMMQILAEISGLRKEMLNHKAGTNGDAYENLLVREDVQREIQAQEENEGLQENSAVSRQRNIPSDQERRITGGEGMRLSGGQSFFENSPISVRRATSIEGLSEFLRKDSRRYDSAFDIY